MFSCLLGFQQICCPKIIWVVNEWKICSDFGNEDLWWCPFMGIVNYFPVRGLYYFSKWAANHGKTGYHLFGLFWKRWIPYVFTSTLMLDCSRKLKSIILKGVLLLLLIWYGLTRRWSIAKPRPIFRSAIWYTYFGFSVMNYFAASIIDELIGQTKQSKMLTSGRQELLEEFRKGSYNRSLSISVSC